MQCKLSYTNNPLKFKIMKTNYLKAALAVAMFICTLSTQAQIIPDGTYNIYNPNLSEVIGVNRIAIGEAGNPQDIIIGRARMQTYDISNSDQEWSFIHQGSDVYKITNVGDNSALGVKDGWCGDFGDVQVGFTDSSPYTLFKIINGVAANTYVFQIAFDGDCNFGSTNVPIKAFDIDGGSSGSKINTFPTDSGNANQEFEIVAPGTLGIDDAFLSDKISIFYNTAEGLVVNSTTNNEIEISVFDMAGRSIITKKSINSRTNIKLHTTSTGIYLAKIKDTNNNTLVKKFLVF